MEGSRIQHLRAGATAIEFDLEEFPICVGKFGYLYGRH